jgi:hypothetical protein
LLAFLIYGFCPAYSFLNTCRRAMELI